jgi:ferredoxin
MCGECESVCPEKAISLNAEGLRLNAARFQPRIVAKDEAFHCVECGKPFAPSRAIAKTIAFMSPLFASDPAKLRALSCCAECKPKVTMKAALKSALESKRS